MKKKVLFLANTFFIITQAYEPTWVGYKIINKTNQQLNIQVHCKGNCNDKNTSTCTKSYGYVLVIPPNKTIINKKDAMSYECENIHNQDALVVEVSKVNGPLNIPPQIIKNPQPKDYTIVLENNNLLNIE